jgi:hypothetical protein
MEPGKTTDDVTWGGQADAAGGGVDRKWAYGLQGRAWTIHAQRVYSDVNGCEILERRSIVEKLAPFPIAKLLQVAVGEMPEHAAMRRR